jgi:type II secretory pathway component GspD/PulD (secretin)
MKRAAFVRHVIQDVFLPICIAAASACGHGAANSASPASAQLAQPTSVATSPVDLELKDAELLDALGLLAGKGGINIFADSDLNQAGPVTVKVHSASAADVLTKIASEHNLRVQKLDVRSIDSAAYWVSRNTSEPAPITSFDGERITARFDETPIRDVAKTLSDFSNTNIVVEDDVQANITLHLRLPWDLALYHLAQKYELRIVRTDHEIRIAHRK